MRFSAEWYRIHQMKQAAKSPGMFGEPVPSSTQREADLHEQIINECKRRQWRYFHGAMHLATSRPLGEPDFHIWADKGRYFAVECKTAKGKLSNEQLWTIEDGKRLGISVHVVRSFEEFLKIINQ